jgi:HD-GYP domain-containing protein (c-di-GMP phosphodiesterase class II)
MATGTLSTIFLADRNSRDRQVMTDALRRYYAVTSFSDGMQALDALHRRHPDLLIVDSGLPGGGGVSLLERLRGEADLAAVPVLSTVADHGLIPASVLARRRDAQPPVPALGTVLCKPFSARVLRVWVSRLISLGVEASWSQVEPVQREALRSSVTLFNTLAESVHARDPALPRVPFRHIRDGCRALVEAVASTNFRAILEGVRAHDDYTYAHSLRVATFLTIFGHGLGLRDDELATITAGGLMHDIGKTRIPHHVLNKPGTLDAEEWHVMRSHVDHTLQALDDSVSLPRGARMIAAQHHEKLDGSGYPLGLAHAQIHELARMATIADIFGALTDRRCYKAPMPAEKALAIMGTMTHAIDGHLLALFREMLLDSVDQIDSQAPRVEDDGPPPASSLVLSL